MLKDFSRHYKSASLRHRNVQGSFATSSLELVDFAYENKTAGNLLTASARGSLSRARLFSKRQRTVNRKRRLHLRRSENVCVYHFLEATQSHQSMCLYEPFYKQSEGCSGTVQRDLLHQHPEPNIHAPILWIKIRDLT